MELKEAAERARRLWVAGAFLYSFRLLRKHGLRLLWDPKRGLYAQPRQLTMDEDEGLFIPNRRRRIWIGTARNAAEWM